MKKKCLKGFTLVELIVVIAIIGILAVILVPNMMSYVQKAKAKQALADAKTVQNVLSTEYINAIISNDYKNLDKLVDKKDDGYKVVDVESIFDQTLGATYEGIIYDFFYDKDTYGFSYSTVSLQQYRVFYNITPPNTYEVIDENVFSVAKKKD